MNATAIAKLAPLTFLLAAACGKGGGSTDPDWTKLPSKHYEVTVKGVAIAVDAPAGRAGKPGDPKYNSQDYWFMHELGYSPSISLSVHDYQRPLDEDTYFSTEKTAGNIVSSESFANGYAYTQHQRDTEYASVVVLSIDGGKSVQCEAMAGGQPADKQIQAKLPALDAICRSLVANGVKVQAGAAAPVAAGSGAAGSGADGSGAPAAGSGALPAECTAYLDLMGKLAACDKLDAGKRDGLKFAAEHAASAWAKLPPDQLAPECKAGAEGLAADRTACGL